MDHCNAMQLAFLTRPKSKVLSLVLQFYVLPAVLNIVFDAAVLHCCRDVVLDFRLCTWDFELRLVNSKV